jgi:hypothetical protein
MGKAFCLFLMVLGAAAFVFAGPASTPEIDPSSGASALTLLAGAILMFRNKTNRS